MPASDQPTEATSMDLHSDEGSEEQWDDMAIVRAFEDALSGQGRRNGYNKKKQQTKASHSTSKRQTRSVSIEEEDDEDEEDERDNSEERERASPISGGKHASKSGHKPSAIPSAPDTNGFASQQYPSDLYQAAYAQAYAHLQSQLQASNPSHPAYPPQQQQQQQWYGGNYQYQMPSPYPPQPFHSTGNAAIPGVMPIPSMPHSIPYPSVQARPMTAAGSDDSLANLLLSWYQSGYYTGRFQAMQEMNARNHQ